MILEDNPRRRPQTFGGIVYLVVVTMVASGLVIVAAGAWRTGVGWLGAGLLVGALLRLLLPDQRAGMLRVRRKGVDAGLLVLAGAMLIFLSVNIPSQPGQ